MAELKTKPTGASVAAFLGGIEDPERRRDCRALVKLMSGVTGAKPRMWGPSIVGFGSCRLRYASGRVLDWFPVGFSPRQRDLTLYLLSGFAGKEPLLKRLGAHRKSVSCLYLKRLADVDARVLRALVARSVAEMRERSA